jgi:SAM-dependent methyltransferase
MNSREVRQEAKRRTTPVAVDVVAGTMRWNVIDPLPKHGNIGIELGVAAGSFSARMVQSGRFAQFYGVDAYTGRHSVPEYKTALITTGLWSDYRLLRMTFAQALDLFPDRHFDFIYCDGYAHTGEEGGRTLTDWYAKLKPGGVMSGDDYDADAWPLVVWAVNHVVARLGVPLRVTDVVTDEAYCGYRSWFFVKPLDGPDMIEPAEDLEIIGAAERLRIETAQREKRQARRAATDSPPRES